MSFLFIALAIGLAASFAAALIAPLRGDPADDRDASAGHALAERLGDIDRARDAGLLDESDADEAALEAQRAAIAMAAAREMSAAPGWRAAAVAFIAVAPILVGALYFQVGAPAEIADRAATAGGGPGGADPGAAIAALPPQERLAAIEAMVEGLAARLEAEPNDPDGWRMLARSQAALGRLDSSIESRRRLLAMVEGDLADWKDFAAAIVQAREAERFPVDQEFLAALSEIEARSPGDAFVAFYRGGAALEGGERAEAALIWRALLASMPPDAPVRGVLEALIAEAETPADRE